LLVSGDTSLAGLHRIVQAAFGWSDARGHYFVIRGKQYSGAESLLSESATLATFHFRMKERFLYHHGLSDGWRHQIRFEGTPVLGESRASAVCVGGARAGPSDEYATPRDYAGRLSLRRDDAPWAERLHVCHALARLAHAEPDETVREAIGDVDAFAEAVQRIGAYDRLNPGRFDRHDVNRRLRVLCRGRRTLKGIR
jgi:hypothetical protein